MTFHVYQGVYCTASCTVLRVFGPATRFGKSSGSQHNDFIYLGKHCTSSSHLTFQFNLALYAPCIVEIQMHPCASYYNLMSHVKCATSPLYFRCPIYRKGVSPSFGLHGPRAVHMYVCPRSGGISFDGELDNFQEPSCIML